MADNPTCPTPCATCPFLRENQGRPHGAGWYTKKNLVRLWNGLRTGKAPGMVCHSTDPDSPNYGGTKDVKPGHKRECIGANTLIQRELTTLAKAPSLAAYRKQYPNGLTRAGAIQWVERIMFGGTFLSGGAAPECGDVNDERIAAPEGK